MKSYLFRRSVFFLVGKPVWLDDFLILTSGFDMECFGFSKVWGFRNKLPGFVFISWIVRSSFERHHVSRLNDHVKICP